MEYKKIDSKDVLSTIDDVYGDRFEEEINRRMKKINDSVYHDDYSSSKYVVFKLGNYIYIVTNMVDSGHVMDLESDILKKYNGYVTFLCNSNLSNHRGLNINIAENGDISIEGDVDEIEFHNQDVKLNGNVKQFSEKKKEDNIDLDKIFSFAFEDKSDELRGELKTVGAGNVWKKIKEKLDNNEISKDDFYNLVEYLISDKYDKYALASDNTFINDEYRKLIKSYPIEEKDDTKELSVVPKDNTKELSIVPRDNIVHDIIPSTAKKVERSKVSIFSGLKKKIKNNLKKLACAAAGIALIGTTISIVNNKISKENKNDNNEISQDLNNKNEEKNSNVSSNDNIQPQASNSNEEDIKPSVYIKWDEIGNNHVAYVNSYDAVGHENDKVANEWFIGNAVDVFDTTTNQYLNLSKEQLNDYNYLKSLSDENPNLAVLLGNSIDDPSGFENLSDVLASHAKGGKSL